MKPNWKPICKQSKSPFVSILCSFIDICANMEVNELAEIFYAYMNQSRSFYIMYTSFLDITKYTYIVSTFTFCISLINWIFRNEWLCICYKAAANYYCKSNITNRKLEINCYLLISYLQICTNLIIWMSIFFNQFTQW